MCAICMKTPCDSRCPNAPEIETERTCVLCGGPIYTGEEFFESEEGPVCIDCLTASTPKALIEMCGEELKTA